MATFCWRAARGDFYGWGCSFWGRAVLLLCAAALAGCYSSSTSVKLRDPSRVSVSFRRLGQSTLRPLPTGSADMSVDLAALRVDQSGSIHRSDGAISIECPNCVDGNLSLLTEDGATAPADVSVAALLDRQEAKERKLALGYEHGVTDSQKIFPEMETQWSNVEHYDQTSEPVRALGWLLVPGGFLTVAGALVMVLESVPAGLSMLIPGVGLDTFGIVQLVLNPSEERFGPDGKPVYGFGMKAPEGEEEEEPAGKAEREREIWRDDSGDRAEEEAAWEEEEEEEVKEKEEEVEEEEEEVEEEEEEVEEEEEEPPPPPKKEEKKPSKPKGGEEFDDFLL